jgi:hypothetical protein
MMHQGYVFEGTLYWVVSLIIAAVGVWASAVVLKRAGYPQWWALLFLVPVAYLIGLWAFAYARWPAEEQK